MKPHAAAFIQRTIVLDFFQLNSRALLKTFINICGRPLLKINSNLLNKKPKLLNVVEPSKQEKQA